MSSSWLNVLGENGIHSLWGQRNPTPSLPPSIGFDCHSNATIRPNLLNRVESSCIEHYLFKSDYTRPEICLFSWIAFRLRFFERSCLALFIQLSHLFFFFCIVKAKLFTRRSLNDSFICCILVDNFFLSFLIYAGWQWVNYWTIWITRRI